MSGWTMASTLHWDDRDELARMVALIETKNPNDNHRGLLATIPCSGWALEGPEGEVRMRSFVRFCARRKRTVAGVPRWAYENAVPESRLRDLLAKLVGLNVLDDRSLPKTPASSYSHHSFPSECQTADDIRRLSGKARQGADRAASRSRTLDRAHQMANPQGRMRFASSLFFVEHGRYAEVGELVAYYERLGLHTGHDDNMRAERARTALNEHKAHPWQGKLGIAYEHEEWKGLIERNVTDAVRGHVSIRYRDRRRKTPYPIENELLTALLCLMTYEVMKAKRTDWMFTVGQEAQLRWYEGLAKAGVLASKFKDKTKRVDAVKLLQLAGVIVLRDARKVYGGPGRGVCQKYGLGPNHPLYRRFVALHGDVRDPLGLPCIVGDDGAVVAA